MDDSVHDNWWLCTKDVVTRRSTTGYLLKISEEPVSWQSRLQSSVAIWYMVAEYMAASADTQEDTWLNQHNNKLVSNPRPTRIREDYKSTSWWSPEEQAHWYSKIFLKGCCAQWWYYSWVYTHSRAISGWINETAFGCSTSSHML